MFTIRQARQLNAEMMRFVIDAQDIAAKARPGQFVIVHARETSERIPLTISEANRDEGTITLIFQLVGASTCELATLRAQESLRDVVGPLGQPTDFGDAQRVCIIGGGLGTAIAYPQARWLHEHGRTADVIVGFRTRDIIMLQDELATCSDELTVMTDDGSNGNKGFVTVALQHNIEVGRAYDLVIAIGPPIMMKNVCDITKRAGIKTIVSLNPIMVDGTGMCGGCRVKIAGEYKHACVDGPDFDGHAVDWQEVIRRGAHYLSYEQEARTRFLECDTGKARP